jgi:TolB-like protein/Flp pilus assembly protein TadD
VLAGVTARLGRRDEAIALYDELSHLPGMAARAFNQQAWTFIGDGRFDEADAAVDRSIEAEPYSGSIALKVLLAQNWRGDLELAEATLKRLPASALREDRNLAAVIRVYQWRRDPENLLAMLRGVPRDWITWRISGPKAAITGDAHEMAGRLAAARNDWRKALGLVEQRLVATPDDHNLITWKAYLLTALGEGTPAAETMKLAREMNSSWRQATVAYSHRPRLDSPDETLARLEQLVTRGVSFPVLLGSLRLNPEFDHVRSLPRFQTLLANVEADGRYAPKPPTRVGATASAAPTDNKSVAVLAFANLSDDKDNEHFSDGISEELLNVLAKVPGLKVSARTSAFYFKGKPTQIADIAKQLGVAYVIEGSVRKVGSRVRITAQLIKAADGFHVWSENFDRELKDIFAVQDEIAGLIAKSLALTLAGGSGQKHEANAEVVQMYFEGRRLWNLRTPEALEQAEKFFRRSIAIDPAFGRGYAGLADVLYTRRISFANDPGRFGNRDPGLEIEVIALARRALELDPAAAEALETLGLVNLHLWRFDEGIRQLRRAVELNPNYAPGFRTLGRALATNGQLNEGVDALRRAVELDPISISLDNLALSLCVAGRAAEGLAAAERGLSQRPDSRTTLAWQAYALLRLNRINEARAIVPALQRHLAVSSALDVCSGTEVFLRAIIARVWYESGSRVELADLLASSKARDPIAGFFVSAMAGGGKEALPLPNWDNFNRSNVDKLWLPEFDSLRSEPKFAALIDQLGLTAAQERVLAFRRIKESAP